MKYIAGILGQSIQSPDYEYLFWLRYLADFATNPDRYARKDRTGVGVYGTFGPQMRFDLRDGKLPLLTTKKVHTRSIIYELLWFLVGDTNIEFLNDNGVTIWDEWADPNGDLGPIYGRQWRSWPTPDGSHIDQIEELIERLRNNPTSRRHVVSAWNVGELDFMQLSPCHCLFQFYVSNDGELSCQLYQRSADIFLGVPFNIASYALLTHMIAQVCGLQPGMLIHTFGDLHLYANHIDQAREQSSRGEKLDPVYVELNTGVDSINGFTYDDITIHGYNPHPQIIAPVAV